MIDVNYMLLSMLATVFVLYVFMSNKEIVIKQPKLNNPGELSDLYMDDNKVCYRYRTVRL